MGKPFSQELALLSSTYSWAINQDIQVINSLKSNLTTPVIVVGSGGSLSACYLAVSLLQKLGVTAKAVTPLELHYSKNTLRHNRILFISAGGRNNDILFAFKTAVEESPVSIITVCMRRDTPLTKLAMKYSVAKTVEYLVPAGKDGFLATNSLIAYFTLLIKALYNESFLIDKNQTDEQSTTEIDTFTKKLGIDSTTSILFGGWGHPVAVDIESKFTEAGLGNINIADYRNFAHGRHHWFAKREKNSSIIAIITPEEELLAAKTLALLPSSIPKLILRSRYSSPEASLELLIKSFKLIQAVGRQRKIDPGKPNVPDFGRKLYNLRYSSLIQALKNKNHFDKRLVNIILKKSRAHTFESLSKEQTAYWLKAYKTFIDKLTETKFGCLVFDYDGTLCSPYDRFSPLTDEIKHRLNEILRYGFVIGIITGRGQSARKEMQAAIAKEYWNNVVMGYYNGADIGILGNNALPNRESKFSHELKKLFDIISNHEFPSKIKTELRPKQLTIQIENPIEWQKIKPSILQIVMKTNFSGIQVLESSHSMDIIKRPEVSKLNILSHCRDKASALKLSPDCLCIGDRGQWPGNDFELLGTPYSLSVDEVSSDLDSCWNLSPGGINGIDSTILYLMCIQPHKSYFKFKYEK